MDWFSTDMAKSLGLLKQKMTLFLDDENITDNAAKGRKICKGVGDEGLKRLNASDLSGEQKANPLELWTLFEKQLNMNVYFRIHTHVTSDALSTNLTRIYRRFCHSSQDICQQVSVHGK